MKSYNIDNYIRYKKDVEASQPESKQWSEYTRDELIVKFLPLIENIAKKFSTAQQASGVLDITDLIQFGSIGLIQAIDRLDWGTLNASDDLLKSLKSFLSKRVKGSIRRALDINRGNIKIPEHKLIEIRKDNGNDERITALFFNSIFSSIDEPAYNTENEENMLHQIPDLSEKYNIAILNSYLIGILKKYLTQKESDIIRLSYGLDDDKHSASEIAALLNIEGSSALVRISEIKKQAIQKLIDNVPPDQVVDFL